MDRWNEQWKKIVTVGVLHVGQGIERDKVLEDGVNVRVNMDGGKKVEETGVWRVVS